MTTKKVRRKNRKALAAMGSAGIAAATFAGLAGMSFSPPWGAIALALAAGGLALAATEAGLIASVVALSLPIAAADPILGIIFLVSGVVAVHYLGSDCGPVLLVIAAGIAGAALGPAWAAAAIAGYILGAGEGALAAAIAAVAVQALGLLTGRDRILAVITGGSDGTRLLDFSASPDSFFKAGWLVDSVAGLGANSLDGLSSAFANVSAVPALVIQPLLWAAAAVVAGAFARIARRNRQPILLFAGVAAAAFVPAVGAAIAFPLSGLPADWTLLATSGAGSAILAVGFVVMIERFFPLQVVRSTAEARQGSMAAEDADVDELLRLISTAEERLASEHTTERVIMITDMKSFSTMTEEDGSVLTAKAIQMHRDLLLPIIEAHGGHGKSTGGDGLIAAFSDAASALKAAAQMQSTLDAHNSSHPGQRQMTIRIGIAQGEVVLDKGGRPFIGNALNLAARIMNLADGGQAFCSADIAAAAPGAVPIHSHGPFELKNITKPVEVLEIIWAEGLCPVSPNAREA